MNREPSPGRLPQRREAVCPPLPRTALHRSRLIICLLLLGVCWGCGTGAYEGRLDAYRARLDEEARQKVERERQEAIQRAEFEKKRARLAAKFKDMGVPRPLPGTSVSFSLPTQLPGLKDLELKNPTPLCENGKTRDGQTMDPRRASPGVELPVPINLTYNPTQPVENRDYEFYCYLAQRSFRRARTWPTSPVICSRT